MGRHSVSISRTVRESITFSKYLTREICCWVGSYTYFQLSVTYRTVWITTAVIPIRWVDGTWYQTCNLAIHWWNTLPTALSRLHIWSKGKFPEITTTHFEQKMFKVSKKVYGKNKCSQILSLTSFWNGFKQPFFHRWKLKTKWKLLYFFNFAVVCAEAFKIICSEM